jgi:hypothetical protein
MRHDLATGFLLALMLGCSNANPPVPVRGDVTRLQGQWTGEYSSLESGRSGSIVFTLRAGSDTAFGDVIMIPAEAVARPFGMEKDHELRPPGYHPELLTIRFVQVSGDKLMGDLDPYPDPQCGCQLWTTFTGTLKGDVLEGTYRSYHNQEQQTTTGRWRATRNPSSP